MPDSDRLDFVAYLEPRQSTVEWYKELLYQLWRYGLSFSPQWEKILSWEEELQHQPDFFIAGSKRQYPQPQKPLAEWLNEAAAAGSATLNAYDKNCELFLRLQPGGSETFGKLGRIEISYGRSLLNPDQSPTEDLLPLYLQIWCAHIHWAEVCCTLLKPLYALSYQLDDIIYQKSNIPGSSDSQPIEDPLLKMLEEVRKTFPILVPMLSQTRLQYFSPQLLTEEKERSLLRQPYQFSEYLPTGGLVVIPRIGPFHYGYGIAYNLINRSRETEENDEEAKRLMERGNDIIDLYRHMQTKK